MEPDRVRRQVWRRAAKAGGNAFPVARLTPPPPPEPQRNNRQSQPEQNLVKQLSHGNRMFGRTGKRNASTPP